MMRNGGYFIEHLPNGRLKFHKNTLVQTGASWFLRTVFRGEAVLPATYYMGLTNAGYSFDGTTLAGLAAGEPVGNGYARQALTKNTVDWTVQEVNGAMQALSKNVTFTASADWTQAWTRAFLCDAAAGTVGNVIAVAGPAPAPRTVLNGQGPTMNYTFYLRG
jgi:hypothetical protein